MSNFYLICDWLINDKELPQVSAIIKMAATCSCHLYFESRITSEGFHVATFIVQASSTSRLEDFTREAKEQTIFPDWVENKTIKCPESGGGLETSPGFLLPRIYDVWIAKGRENQQLIEKLRQDK